MNQKSRERKNHQWMFHFQIAGAVFSGKALAQFDTLRGPFTNCPVYSLAVLSCKMTGQADLDGLLIQRTPD